MRSFTFVGGNNAQGEQRVFDKEYPHISYSNLHCVNTIMYWPTLCHFYPPFYYVIGRILETFIVSTISCIDRHCIISIKPFIEQYCAMWQDIGDLHCVNNIMYRPTLYHFYQAIYWTVLCHVARHWRPSLCQQYHVSTDIVSFLSSHLLNSIVPCGKTLETFIVSTISCIDQHCVISIIL